MGRIPRWPRLAVARGMNKGNCSFFARSARFSSGRGRILIYLETSSHLLRSPITFRPPRSISFSSTKPANFTIESTKSIHRQLAKVFIIRLLALLRPSLHFADSLQYSSIPARSQVARWRSTTRRPTIGPTDPANGRRAPSRCLPPSPCLEPYAADVHLALVAFLEYAPLLQFLSSLDSAGSSFFPTMTFRIHFITPDLDFEIGL